MLIVNVNIAGILTGLVFCERETMQDRQKSVNKLDLKYRL